MTLRNPYATVDWAGEQVPSLSHEHIQTKSDFDQLYPAYKAFASSSYNPSAPRYPLTTLSGMTTGNIPADVIALPNAEHYGMTNAAGHYMAIGSTITTGSGSPASGWGGTLEAFLAAADALMLYPNAGLFCANHPNLGGWVGAKKFCALMDQFPRFRSLELYNGLADWHYGVSGGFAHDDFHDVLKTGRQVLGLGAPDHFTESDPGTRPAKVRGFNRLLLPTGFWALTTAQKEEACLKAYYDGHFYVAVEDGSPQLEGATATDAQVQVQWGASCTTEFYVGRLGSNQLKIAGGSGTSATYTVTPADIYVYAVGRLSELEVSITQAFMFKNVADLPTADFAARQMGELLLLGVAQ
ncbi:MAG: hypothetical protein EON59_03250 [Alphaproteobacteria bacterium]|nr:MAG: hypothetical protein EON59_03250 [Alphaproteobacteria bacterium]